MRLILDRLSSLIRSGCLWRLLPWHVPSQQMVYHSFWLFRLNGTREQEEGRLYVAGQALICATMSHIILKRLTTARLRL